MITHEYDSEADALYITLSTEKYSHGIDLDMDRRIDYSGNNSPIGIELLSVSKGVDITDIPFEWEVGNIIRQYGFPYHKHINFSIDSIESITGNSTMSGILIIDDNNVTAQLIDRDKVLTDVN